MLTELSSCKITSIFDAYPTCASSIELSSISYTYEGRKGTKKGKKKKQKMLEISCDTMEMANHEYLKYQMMQATGTCAPNIHSRSLPDWIKTF